MKFLKNGQSEFIKISINTSKKITVPGVEKTKFFCPKHGNKWQLASVHTKGHGCRECAGEAFEEIQRLKQEADFQRVLKAIYGAKIFGYWFFS